MKRLLIGVVALAMALTFAVPAMADFNVGLMSFTDIGYWGQDDDRVAYLSGDPNASSRTQAFLDEATYSRIYARTTNENMGAYFELGVGHGSADFAGFQNNSTNVNFRKIYGYYKFGDIQITAGHTEPLGASRYNPAALLGEDTAGTVFMMGFGNLYQRTTMLALEYRSGILYLGASINSPRYFGLEGREYAPTWSWAGLVGIRTDPFWATLSGLMAYAATDDEPPGADDDAFAWEVNLHMDVKLGFMNIRLHPYYGQNIQNLGYGFLDPTRSVQFTAAGEIEDTDCWGGYIDVTIGSDPFVIDLMAGVDYADNDLYDDEQVMYALVARGEWKVGANFSICPEIGWYDYGDTVVGDIDRGSAWVAGFQFNFIF